MAEKEPEYIDGAAKSCQRIIKNPQPTNGYGDPVEFWKKTFEQVPYFQKISHQQSPNPEK